MAWICECDTINNFKNSECVNSIILGSDSPNEFYSFFRQWKYHDELLETNKFGIIELEWSFEIELWHSLFSRNTSMNCCKLNPIENLRTIWKQQIVNRINLFCETKGSPPFKSSFFRLSILCFAFIQFRFFSSSNQFHCDGNPS